MQYLIPQAERVHWKLRSPGEKPVEQHLFLRGTFMFYLFVLSAMVFDSIAFHCLETWCLGRQAWRVPVFHKGSFSICCIPYYSHCLNLLHPESNLCVVRFSWGSMSWERDTGERCQRWIDPRSRPAMCSQVESPALSSEFKNTLTWKLHIIKLLYAQIRAAVP